MYLARLSLIDLRTFRRLEVELTPGVHVISGANAQGKSNLLEAIAMLATTRSQGSGTDLDLISWDALAEDPIPAARLEAEVTTAGGREHVEVNIVGQMITVGVPPQRAARRFRVNGIARRASDLIGRLRVVLFAADDLAIIDGPPANRRRYLDITLSQLDPAYVRALQRYTRVLEQRNSLLKRLQERRGKPDELDFWDGELAESGAVILAARAEALRVLGRDAAVTYAELAASESEALEVIYEPRVPAGVAARLREHDLAARFLDALVAGRMEDVRRGLSLTGPHRDDVRFLIGGHAAGVSASRGQQRSAALALRLAEVTYSKARTGDAPVLLLDDILSELDPARRARVLSVAYGVDQVLITTPDAAHPSRAELPGAVRWRLHGGVLEAGE
jgi:DNA replication and repair protein RecF